MDLDHNKSLKSQTKNEVIDTGIALKDDPEFAKYFKMLKVREMLLRVAYVVD